MEALKKKTKYLTLKLYNYETLIVKILTPEEMINASSK